MCEHTCVFVCVCVVQCVHQVLVYVCVRACVHWCVARRPAPGRQQTSLWSQTGGETERKREVSV